MIPAVLMIILGGFGVFLLVGLLLKALIANSIGTVLIALGTALIYIGYFFSKLV